jgi:hypothetical protein
MQRTQGSPGPSGFLGFGFLLLAWRVAPGPHSDPMLWLLCGMVAFTGAVLLMQWLQNEEPRLSPWQGFIGRAVWALRPRTWMLAWAVLIAAAWTYGTPHLRWQYAIGSVHATCDYVGWSGTRRWAGNSRDCTLIKFL